MGRASKPSTSVLHKESNKVPAVASSIAPADGSTSVCNGSSSHELTSQLDEHNIRGTTKDTKADYDIKSRKLSYLRPVTVKQLSALDPGPTPTSTPTNPSTVTSRARIPGGSFKSKSSHLGNSVGSLSVSGLYSSASDPVLVPSLNPRNPGTVGIIKRETRNQRKAAEINANLLDDSRSNNVQDVNIDQAVSGSVVLTSNTQSQPTEYQGLDRSQLAMSSRLPSSTSHHLHAAKSNQETCSVRLVNGHSKDAGVVLEDNLHSLPTLEDPCSKQATSELDIKLHKLHISARQSVIFPNHLHVPEAFKNVLTFGSLDPSLEQNNEGSDPRDASVPTNIEASEEPSPTTQSSSPISGHGDYPDQPQSPSHELVSLTSSQENVSSDTALRYDQSKQEMLQPVGRSHNPLVPPMPDYGLSLIPPAGGNSVLTTGTTPTMAQPRGIVQSSIAVSPQLFPFYRQPYPPNYIPYSPYFSQLYMPPQNVHQLLSHTGFPHQPSMGNIYMPPTAAAAAASGAKFPIPPVYRPGNMAGNMTQFGISSGYGSYGSSGPGYGSGAALPTSSSDDIAGSELKEMNMLSAIKQNEDLQSNVFYNLPQGQPVAFPPAQVGHNSFAGIYHPTQNMSTSSLVQTLQQPQPTGGTAESMTYTNVRCYFDSALPGGTQDNPFLGEGLLVKEFVR
ncbi:hypothetical protein DH2020_016954 [Rehmannia glutinosa]|uniref:Uncharacterized protein n=1 Tax=Rehmannia glutinosa TaxID=99300 RepID=A0ABR0WSZ1_REHGL